MKMAKASEADLRMAMELSNALDLLGQQFLPCMPEAIEELADDDESERFDRDDDEQCGRALRHLLNVADRASLMRVIWGCAVMLDPKNRIVDPDLDVLERHPDYEAAESARKDAERYRLLRRKICFTGNGNGTSSMHAINLPDAAGFPSADNHLQFIDAAIDAAITSQSPDMAAGREKSDG